MSKQFYIGQRVRIVRVVQAVEALGREARIDSALVFASNDIYGDYEGYDVTVDGLGARSLDGYRYCFRPECLEPIQPSGHRSGDYTFRELMDRLKAGEVECV